MAATLELYRHLNIWEMKRFKVFISGQKYFGSEVLSLCLKKGFQVIGVCCPLDDKHIGKMARRWNIPIIPAGTLSASTMPDDVDLGITAHSFDYIGKLTRSRPRLGWIGYHPSLLPRHRGRSSVEWAIKMGDHITGGSIFWLNAGIDRGDIAYQHWCWIDPAYRLQNIRESAGELWRDQLLPIGLRLFDQALDDIPKGVIIRMPQDQRHSTFEPRLEVEGIFKPDLLMIGN